MLTRKELQARLAKNDPARKWFLDIRDGNLLDAKGQTINHLVAHPHMVSVSVERARDLEQYTPATRLKAIGR